MINYISTRNNLQKFSFSEVVLNGLAHDGGLYLPEKYPVFSKEDLHALEGQSYTEIAKKILWPYIKGSIEFEIFSQILEKSYQDFRHKAVCPLVQSDQGEFILELFHGPTFAFKDFAMQFLSHLMGHFLQKFEKRATIIGATSGDTGSAAMAAFRSIKNVDIFILFPKGKISPIQQKQMTTYPEKNIHAIAIEGNFDDCQSLVKSLFNDHEFRDKTSLSGVNSINWARILAQIVYYFSAGISLGAFDRKISFTVPTGNFGDIFAGYVALNMGLPIEKLIIATNDNDILVRTSKNGLYEIKELIATSSPSMDIQISSNFERLLFEVYDKNSDIVKNLMASLQQDFQFQIDKKALSKINSIFSFGCAKQPEVEKTIKDLYIQNNYFIDPHTAVGIKVAREHKDKQIPMIVLSTAHPAKFLETVTKSCNICPEMPESLKKLLNKEENFKILPKDESKLKNFILNHITPSHSL